MKTGFTNAAGYNIITSAKRNGHRVIAVTMGHNSIQQRDQKAARMMNKGLQKLALADNIETPNLYAQDHISQPEPEAVQVASLEKEAVGELSESGWGIQVGAFSNYTKARNYALKIRRQAKIPAMAKAQINIEPAQKGAAVIYRSKLVGFAKNEADKTCNRLKKSNQSCIVVAVNCSQQLSMADNN